MRTTKRLTWKRYPGIERQAGGKNIMGRHRFEKGGRRFTFPTETTDPAEAWRRFNAWRGGQADLATISLSKVKLSDLSSRVIAKMKAKGCTQGSINKVERSVGHVLRILGDCRIEKITTEAGVRYVNQRRQEKSKWGRGDDRTTADTTINVEIQVLTTILLLAQETFPRYRKPKLVRPKGERRSGSFTSEEWAIFRLSLTDYIRGFYDANFYLGWRAMKELASRKWVHLDIERGLLTIPDPKDTKNKKPRLVPVGANPELMAIFKAQREYADTVQRKTGRIVEHIFCTPQGRRLPSTTCFHAWNKARIETEIYRVPSDLRRTVITRNELSGVPRKHTKELLGVVTDSVFDGYVEAGIEELSESFGRAFQQAQQSQRKAKVVGIKGPGK